MIKLDSRAALSCHEYLHKNYAPALFDLSKRKDDDPLVKALKEAGGVHEDKVIRYLKTLNIPFIQIDLSKTDKEIEDATFRALQDEQAQLIFGSQFGEHLDAQIVKTIPSVRVSRPDILVRTGTSMAGFPLWSPVDIKSHPSIDLKNKSNRVFVTKLPNLHFDKAEKVTGRLEEKDALQLAHYRVHLNELGFADNSNMGGIIGKNFDFIAWADLTQTMFGTGAKSESAITRYLNDFRRSYKVIEDSIARASNPTNPPVTISRRVGDCPTCEFKIVCSDEMKAFDNNNGHVTLLSEVTAQKAEEHFPGIEGISQLVQQSNLSPFGMKSVLRALVWIDKKPRLIDSSENLGLPEFDIEIDIDLENSQAALQELGVDDVPGKDSIYLYGFGIHDRTKDKDWKSANLDFFDDYSDTEEGELSVLSNMWEKLKEEVTKAEADDKSIGIFHYSPHEVTWWGNFASHHQGKPGVPTKDEVDRFVSKYFVDLLKYTRKIALPVTGYSIKTLAPEAGFRWSADDAGGANSLVKYKTAVSKTSSKEAKDEAIKWLTQYNLDDVRATFAVRAYVRGLVL